MSVPVTCASELALRRLVAHSLDTLLALIQVESVSAKSLCFDK